MPSLDVDLDLGSLPAWLGAGSLLLAYRIFRIDRTNAERAQVDRVGAWASADYTRPPSVSAQPSIRNASELPIEVKQLAYEIHTRWLVERSDGAYESVDSTQTVKLFLNDIRVAPQETWDNVGTPYTADVAHTAPVPGSQLNPIQGAWCEISWLLVVDNAGRKWELRPAKGRRAKRIRWYHRPREYQPSDWF